MSRGKCETFTRLKVSVYSWVVIYIWERVLLFTPKCAIAREAVSLSTWSMQTGGSEGHTQAPCCWPLVARCSTPWTGLLLAAPGQAETRLSASTSRPGNTPADLAPHDLFYLNQSPCCHPCWGGALVARLCLLSQSCCLGSAALFLKPFPIQSSQDFFDLKKKKKKKAI